MKLLFLFVAGLFWTMASAKPTICSTSVGTDGTRPPRCPRGAKCVIKDFGFIAAGRPNSGVCLRIRGIVPVCRIAICSKKGFRQICKTPDTRDITFCGAWPKRSDRGVVPNCIIPCPRVACKVGDDRPVDNFGRSYCSECQLRIASCKSNFRRYGPVKKPHTGGNVGDKCSTKGAPAGPTPCKKALSCVINDFGAPAINQPNSGNCTRVTPPVRTCTVDICVRRGSDAICQTRGTKDVTTCGFWAARTDGNPGPKCDFTCTQQCLARPKRPMDQNGKRYCNPCVLRKASCESNFKIIFG